MNPMHSATQQHQNSGFEKKEAATWAKDIFQIRVSKDQGVNEGADSDTNSSSPSILLLLFTLGGCAGLANGLILWATSAISEMQVWAISFDSSHSGTGLVYFWLSSSACALVAALLCKYITTYAAGSGLPEFKYLVASEMKEADYDRFLSKRVFATKSLGLILSAGSSLSIGSEGPLVHTAASIAYMLMKYVGEFGDILTSPSLCKQIFAASAAVGVSSAFNAPVGGLLFSIEVTSTFYLVSNYWKSFIAAVAGSVACNIFLISKGATSDPLLTLNMAINPHPFVKWELIIFLIIGITLGYAAHFYLKVHQKVNELLRPYTKPYPLAVVVLVTLFTSTMIFATGAYDSKSVGVIAMVSDVLTTGSKAEMQDAAYVTRLGGLIISLLVRAVLTLLGTNIPIPAGIFMPVFLIGGIMGRFVGVVIRLAMGDAGTVIDIPAYALVGACAFSAGITHTISVAVIAVELTGNIHMLLPCLLVAVVAAGITKSKGCSVYDQGMVNKGLESIQLLLMESGTRHTAGDIMDTEVLTIPRICSLKDLVQILKCSSKKQDFYPVLEDVASSKLLGAITRYELFIYLLDNFNQQGYLDQLKQLVPNDYHEYIRRKHRSEVKQENSRKKRKIMTAVWKFIDTITDERILFGESSPDNGSTVYNPVINSIEEGRNNDAHLTGEVKEIELSPLHRPQPCGSESENSLSNSQTVPDSPSKRFSAIGMMDAVLTHAEAIGQSAARAALDLANSTVASPIIDEDAPPLISIDEILTLDFFTVKTDAVINLGSAINNHPFTVARNTSMEHVYVLFEMVKVPCVLIAVDGILEGMISRAGLLHSLKSKKV